MSESKEMVCLKALEELLQKHFDKEEYSLNGSKESAVCMSRNGKKWDIYEKEKNSFNDLVTYNTVIEACMDMIKRMFLSQSECDMAMEQFLDRVIVSKIA